MLESSTEAGYGALSQALDNRHHVPSRRVDLVTDLRGALRVGVQGFNAGAPGLQQTFRVLRPGRRYDLRQVLDALHASPPHGRVALRAVFSVVGVIDYQLQFPP